MRRPVRRRSLAVTAIVAVLLFSPLTPGAAGQGQRAQCSATGGLVPLPGLAEASGLAISRRTPGRLWSHNDSGQPVVFALDAQGKVAGQIRVSGASVEDWEAIAVGPCGDASCLYIADIGDNEAERSRITIYRVPEPEGNSGTVKASGVFHATYPDGRHDAEALLVSPEGRLYIVTKGDTGPVALYRFPAQLQEGSAMRLERVGGTARPGADGRITDGAISRDGRWIVLRSRSALTFYQASELLSGKWRAATTVDLRPLKEPQGEGVALGDDTVFLTSEGGGKSQPGRFARFACAPGGK
jgi:hypothetical protein